MTALVVAALTFYSAVAVAGGVLRYVATAPAQA